MDGISNVMGAMVDIDESTLIRSRVIDDDYEIKLRKRALVQEKDDTNKCNKSHKRTLPSTQLKKIPKIHAVLM